jgi:ubiquinone biosynthesis protein
MKSLLKLQGLAEDVPTQLSQILVDLEGGKFRVNVHSDAIDRIGGHVRALAVMVFLGLLAAGFTVGAFVVAAGGGPLGITLGALGVAALLSGAAAAYHVATLRMKKLSLRRILRR